jgi:hypothetical protein
LERLAAVVRSEPEPDVDLIDALPRVGVGLASAPDEIQRAVYDAYGLEIHYHHQRREVTLRATVTQRTLGAVHAATRAAVGAGHAGRPRAAAGCAGHENGAGGEPDAEDPLRDPVSHVLCAPGVPRSTYERPNERPAPPDRRLVIEQLVVIGY